MAVPDFQEFFPPILNMLNDNNTYSVSDILSSSIKMLNLTEEDLAEMVPSGKQTRVYNRVIWTLTYLKKALLIDSPNRANYRITERGKKFLQEHPNGFTKKDLFEFDEFKEFATISDNSTQHNETKSVEDSDITPEDQIGILYNQINLQLEDELLQIIFEKDPYSFERLVVDILRKMGYGEGFVTKKSRDDGVDGIINQDELGLDKIFVQAKRWKNTVHINDVKNFVASMEGATNKGVFITTSNFANTVIEYLSRTTKQVILINGKKLVDLMVKYNVGVQNNYSYDIKKIDRDYFEEL